MKIFYQSGVALLLKINVHDDMKSCTFWTVHFACFFNESKIIELNDIVTILTPFVMVEKIYIWAREAFNFCFYLAFINDFLLSFNNLSGCLYLYF